MAVWPRESAWPGIVVCAGLTVLAAYLYALPYPPFTLSSGLHPISAVLLAILLGMLVRNVIPASARLAPGVNSMVKKGLPVGIVLLGARLDFYDLVRVALHVLVGATVLILIVIVLTSLLSRWFKVEEKMGLLIGTGTAICGSSAIVAVAPVLNAQEEEMAYSIGVINILGVIAMLLFPVMGSILDLDATIYGVWCGLGIHATPQVIAAGFAHTGEGQVAGEMATIVKLVRISLLGPAVFVLGAWYALRRRSTTYVAEPIRYSRLVPGFVILFLGLALLRTLGFLPEVTLHLTDQFPFGGGDFHIDLAGVLSQSGKWVITGAMAGVGLATELRTMRAGGFRPLVLGILSAVGIALLALAIANV